MGVDAYGRPVAYDMATPSHLLVAGQTRSGKSVLMQSLLAQLAAVPGVVLAGSDPSGILLAPVAEAGRYGGRIALGTEDAASHLDAFAWLDRVFRDRQRLLVRQGRDKIDVDDPATPLVVFVAEEYLSLTQLVAATDAASSPRGRDAARLKALVLSLSAQALKCGIRMIVSVQRSDAEFLGGPARSNLATRILLRSEPEASRMVFPDLSDGDRDWIARALPGCGLVEAPGLPRQRFRGYDYPYAAYRDRVRYCASVRGATRGPEGGA
nr:FtsK/SpoIIIE domain-containing protein [Bifidobacterium amazonense]